MDRSCVHAQDAQVAIDLARTVTARPAAGFDEVAADADAYAQVLGGLADVGLDALRQDVQRELGARGVRFGSGDGASEFVVDPIPRIIAAAEWERLAAGLAQRLRALEGFVSDVYGAQQILDAGVMPRAAVERASFYEPQLRGMSLSSWITFAGLDVVRDADGGFLVLEDNVRTPSGLGYALAVREAVAARVPVPANRALLALTPAPALFARAIRAAAPEGASDPHAVLLTDGSTNSAFYEHRTLAALMGVPLVCAEQLEMRFGRLWARLEDGRMAVDVLYRRTDADRLFDSSGRLQPLGELLFEPWRRGRLGLVNAFGTGVADDKLVHSYVEDMVRFYLSEEPLLASVPTHDVSRPDVLEMVLDRLAELVIKPRDGHGGQGVVIGPSAAAHELARARAELVEHPEAFVAQELVALSTHPTVTGGRLRQYRVDLRPFVVRVGDDVEIVPGGLTRVALDPESFVVNSSRRGGAKDTWVLA